MNLIASEAIELSKGLIPLSEKAKKSMIWVAPTFTSISAVQNVLKDTTIKVGAQNIHWESTGAFTGEISHQMLRELCVEFVIVGHSERRQIFGETNEMISKRLKKALENNFYGILCIGETEIERREGATEDIIESQLESCLYNLDMNEYQSLVIAYEPVWAIGTGNVASLDQIESAHKFIRKKLEKLTKDALPPIIYGGSVTPDNFESIISTPEVHGALVGGASLDIQKFTELSQIIESN